MAKAGDVKFEKAAFKKFIQSAEVTNLLQPAAQAIARTARATAKAAELGSTRLEGYAGAGFGVEVQKRSKRQRIIVKSNADPKLAMRVHFATQKKNGIGHMRQVMKETGGIEWPSKR